MQIGLCRVITPGYELLVLPVGQQAFNFRAECIEFTFSRSLGPSKRYAAAFLKRNASLVRWEMRSR